MFDPLLEVQSHAGGRLLVWLQYCLVKFAHRLALQVSLQTNLVVQLHFGQAGILCILRPLFVLFEETDVFLEFCAMCGFAESMSVRPERL